MEQSEPVSQQERRHERTNKLSQFQNPKDASKIFLDLAAGIMEKNDAITSDDFIWYREYLRELEAKSYVHQEKKEVGKGTQ